MGKALTTVASIAIATAPGLHRVSGAVGLHLQVGESGGKSWVYRFRLNGRRRLMGLGPVDKVTLADARKAAIAAAALRGQGIDPIADRRATRAEYAAAARPAPKVYTFRAVADDYLALKAEKWKAARSARALGAALDRWIHPVLGDQDIAAITIDDVAAALRPACDAVPFTARSLRSHVQAIISMAAALGYRDPRAPNPASLELLKYKFQLPQPPVIHFPAAPLDAAPGIYQRVRAAEGTVFRAVEFTILTTVRPGVALRAQWTEVDLGKALWVIPGARMKNGKEFTVPLVPAAMEVLAAQERVRANEYIFPGARPGRPLSYNVFQTALAQKLGITGVSLHGFRSVFRDWAGDVADVPRDIAEAQLSHSLGATEGAYRRLTAVEKRRAVLVAYADWLLGRASSNVVPFRAAV
jgi:integrase